EEGPDRRAPASEARRFARCARVRARSPRRERRRLRRVPECQRGDGDGQHDDCVARVRSWRYFDRIAQSDGSRGAEDRQVKLEGPSAGGTPFAIRPSEGQRIGGEEPSRTSETKEASPSFGNVLEKTVEAASAKQTEAVAKAEAVAQGRLDDLHG